MIQNIRGGIDMTEKIKKIKAEVGDEERRKSTGGKRF
jgi:hypothetical protein